MNEKRAIFSITSDLFGDGELATEDDIRQMVAEWDDSDWMYSVSHNKVSDDLRVYATRIDGDDTTPSIYTDWIKITDNDFYIVVGELVNSID